MKTIFYSLVLCIAFIFPALYSSELFAQCGIAPTSGTATISTNSIVNSYYPGTGSPVAGASSLTVGTLDARGADTTVKAGDLIFIIQMQGADINTTNTVSYGSGGATAPASGYLTTNLVAGNYEYANVASITGSTITLSNPLVNQYYTQAFTSTTAIQSYQVIRVPRYYNLTISSGFSVKAPAWNGSTGGVVILEVANTFALNGTVSVDSAGFRGGGGKQLTGATTGNSSTNVSGGTTLTLTDYRFNSPVTNAANLTGGAKGEGISGTPAYYYTIGATATAIGTLEGYINGSMGWGAPGNAGGGGTDGTPTGTGNNQDNTGGGGGGNGGAGGKGGNGWPNGAAVTAYPTGGYGGAAFTQYSQQKLIMGGGGGAGTANNSVVGGNEVNSSGGPGGGIIIARAYTFSGSGSVSANGGNAPGVNGAYNSSETDAAGGGGAGGTIIIVTTQNLSSGMGSIKASAIGGIGGSVLTYYNHGPGGGGGGGVIYTDITLGSTAVTGGANGVTYTDANHTATYAYYSVAGSNGIVQSFTGGSSFISVGTPCGVLAITLKNFSAVLDGSVVDLYWQVENEINFNHFEIEHSTDGINFSTIGDVNYFNGEMDYKFIHQTPQPGTNFYRLKMVDADGKYVYSNILLVNLNETNNNKLLIYPNPALSFVTLQYNADNNQQLSVEIFDNSGRRIINKNFTAAKGQNYFSVPDIKYLSKSIYLVKVNNGSKIFTQKLVIDK
jgi:hypothetical protein